MSRRAPRRRDTDLEAPAASGQHTYPSLPDPAPLTDRKHRKRRKARRPLAEQDAVAEAGRVTASFRANLGSEREGREGRERGKGKRARMRVRGAGEEDPVMVSGLRHVPSTSAAHLATQGEMPAVISGVDDLYPSHSTGLLSFLGLSHAAPKDQHGRRELGSARSRNAPGRSHPLPQALPMQALEAESPPTTAAAPKSARASGSTTPRGVLGRGGKAAGVVSTAAYFLSAHKGALVAATVVVLLVAPFASGGAFGSGSPALGIRPNIVLVFPDDNGYNDVNFTNPTLYKAFSTPNLDALAFSGVRLDTYYSASSCTPARCAVMTGRYLPRTGCYGDADLQTPWGLPLDEYTIANYLKRAGYYTTMFGKWHLGSFQKSFIPTSRGFDHFVGFLGGGGDYYEHTDNNGYDWWYDDSVDQSVEGTYSTYVLNSSIQYFLYNTAPQKQPWFMYLPTKVPHGDYTAPEEAIELYAADYGDSETGAWIAEVSMLDDLIGSIVYYLQDTNMYKNTVIIYAGDHGSDNDNPSYDNSYGRVYPFSGGKGNNFEGGVRTPAFVHSPLLPKSMRGQKVTRIASVYDWLPTICSLAGTSPQRGKMPDGWDLTDLLFHGKSLSNHATREVLIALVPCDYDKAANKQEGQQGEGGQGEDMGEENNYKPKSAIRIGDYKMHAGCVDPSSGPEWYKLFNIENDPTESTDLLENKSSSYSSLVKKMIKRLKYFASQAANPNNVCNGCSGGCANNGVWGPFYNSNWQYQDYC